MNRGLACQDYKERKRYLLVTQTFREEISRF